MLSISEAVDGLVSLAEQASKHWASQAQTSKTLDEAVAEYQRRYHLHPPPNFDKWYEFAKEHESPIIDDFNQIHEDLLPFWGVEPEELRKKTASLLSCSNLDMAQIKIRNGRAESSPHVASSHRWMMDSFQRMVEPFSKWLPDMDLAINLSDECRMAVPSHDMNALKHNALRSRISFAQSGGAESKGKKPQTTPWSEQFVEPVSSDRLPSDFVDNVRWQLYYDFIAPTCPPDSPARTKRWWDWSTVCGECMGPHSLVTEEGLLLSNASLAHDLCHQPDLAYQDGFILSPSGAMIGTQSLFPIFSQGRVGGFSDILMPSPWNFDRKSKYDEDADVSWESKSNSLFWRGASTDGYAAEGAWAGFLRARFVHEAYQKRTHSESAAVLPLLNVSFAGSFSKCHELDCKSERENFREWATGTQAANIASGHGGEGLESRAEDEDALPTVPFEENFKHKYLIDMDGAGFSGRFIPFLKSRSLVYRAGQFYTWFDERLTAWHHYIPVDTRIGSGFWAVLRYLSSAQTGVNGKRGDDLAKAIAEQGREWAQKSLRPEDMQIYTFRLLLEWGRLVNRDL